MRRKTRSHLSLVAPVPVRKAEGAGARASQRARAANARVAFWVFVCLLGVSVVLGGVRVAVIAQATRTSLDEGRLQAAIQAQRFEAAQLEVDHSALSSPSRIASIASGRMKMGAASAVHYITLPKEAKGSSSPVRVARAGSGVVSAVSTLVEISAGQAQSLLVGDLGLAGSQ